MRIGIALLLLFLNGAMDECAHASVNDGCVCSPQEIGSIDLSIHPANYTLSCDEHYTLKFTAASAVSLNVGDDTIEVLGNGSGNDCVTVVDSASVIELEAAAGEVWFGRVTDEDSDDECTLTVTAL